MTNRRAASLLQRAGRLAAGAVAAAALASAVAVAAAALASAVAVAGTWSAPAPPQVHADARVPASPGAARDGALVEAVEAVGMTVSDADRTAEFLARVLDFHKIDDVEIDGADFERLEGVFGARVRIVTMQLGGERLDLYEYLAPRGRGVPSDSRSNDRWFQHAAIVVSDIDAAYRKLREHDVEHASPGPQTLPDWNPNAGGIAAFYFKDPDGHVLEIIEFPPGKGDPRWQDSGGKLLLGIDHTAMVVADTEQSLRFYRDTLGMHVAGESENWGSEQERLNNVFGARLRITSLRAPRGPAIELLEYLAPRDGRPYPPDLRANDLAYWRTRLRTPSAERADRAARKARLAFVSPGTVVAPAARLGFGRALTVRDPDGHAMQIVSQ